MKIKFLIKILPFFLTSFFALAQQTEVDSLEKWVAKYPKKDTVWLKNMIKLERMYVDNMSPKKVAVGKLILDNSRRLNYEAGINKGLMYLVYSYIDDGDFVRALSFSLERLSFNEKKGNRVEEIETYNLLVTIHAKCNNIQKALDYSLLAKKKIDVLPTNTRNWYISFCNINTGLANLYTLQEKHEKAIQVYLEVIEKVNEGIIYDKMRPAKAYYFLCVTNSNIAFLYFQSNNFKLSAEYAQRALTLSKQHQVPLVLPPVLNMMVLSYLNIGQFDKAEKYLEQVETLKDENKLLINEIISFYDVSKDFYLKKRDFEKAYYAQKQFVTLKDSVNGTEVQNKLNDLEKKYETQKKELKIASLQNEQKLNNTRSNYYLGLAVMLVFCLMGSLIAIWQINKAKQKVEKANNQRDKLFAIVAHDLRSPVSTLRRVTSKVKHVLDKNDPKATKLLSTTIENSANSLYNLVDNLLYWSLLQQGKIKSRVTKFVLSYEISEVVETLRFKAISKRISLLYKDSSLVEVNADRMIVQTIIRNVLDNAIKFTPENGSVEVKTTLLSDRVELTIKDTGVGIRENLVKVLFDGEDAQKNDSTGTDGEKGKGVGLYLCYELAKMIGCDLKLLTTSKLGTTFVLILPLPNIP
jgi:two-component system, sensor histidine kinase and response regulator